MVWQAQAMGAAAGMYGAKRDKDNARRMMHAREQAIKAMIKKWKRGYDESQGQFEAERQGIMGREQSAMGGVTAGAAGAGLLGTTVGANMARGVRSDTNRSLLDLSSKKASTEYGQWMDLAGIKSNTKWGDSMPQSQAASYGQAGAEMGNVLFGGEEGGGIDWKGLFG